MSIQWKHQVKEKSAPQQLTPDFGLHDPQICVVVSAEAKVNDFDRSVVLRRKK